MKGHAVTFKTCLLAAFFFMSLVTVGRADFSDDIIVYHAINNDGIENVQPGDLGIVDAPGSWVYDHTYTVDIGLKTVDFTFNEFLTPRTFGGGFNGFVMRNIQDPIYGVTFYTNMTGGLLDTDNPERLLKWGTQTKQYLAVPGKLHFLEFNLAGVNFDKYSYFHADVDFDGPTLEPVAVPEPATMLLLGSALAGLFIRRRSIKQEGVV